MAHRQRGSRLATQNKDYNMYAKSEDVEDMKKQEKLEQQQIKNNIPVVIRDKDKRYEVIVKQCETNKGLVDKIAEKVEAEFTKEPIKKKVDDNKLDLQKVLDAENILMGYQIAGYLSLLHAPTREKKSLAAVFETDTEIWPGALKVLCKMTSPGNASRHLIKMLIFTDWSLDPKRKVKKDVKFTDKNYPNIFEKVFTDETKLIWCAEEKDDDNDIKMQHENRGYEHFQQDLSLNQNYCLKNFIEEVKQELVLVEVSPTKALVYLEIAANSLHVEMLGWAKITLKNLRVMVRDMKIPPNKSDPKQFIFKQLDGPTGIKNELWNNYCFHFVNDGLTDLSEADEYEKIADTYKTLLQPYIHARVQKYYSH
eukprot:55138_1